MKLDEEEEEDEGDVKKGKDDLGEFEEKTSKKGGEPDQFTDPFKRKDKVKAKDVDDEI